MKKIISLVIFSLFFLSTFAQNIWINDPQTWRGGQGTIEETQITYEPRGLFMKVDWEITFSARGLEEFTEKDTVEVVYNFNLPKDAIVTDSWLWFNDSIIKGLIMDRWKASQVYENIVNRRKDPSILYKRWGNNFELRIFPMAAKESRKVKITFLTPTNWTPKNVNAHFLAENLMPSKHPIEKIDIFAKVEPQWGKPYITAEENILLEPIIDDEFGNTHHISYHFKQLWRDQKFVVNTALNDGYFFSFFEEGDKKYYQLALNPMEGVEFRKPQKVLFLIDYQKDNSEISQDVLLNLLTENLTGLLTPQDSFNILSYGLHLHQAGKNWINGDSASVAQAIANMGETPFASYGNLPTLLAEGIDLAKMDENVRIVLLANSDKLSDIEAANELLEDLMELMDPVMPVFIGDFQTRNYYYNWIRSVNYRGNEYFYRNLAKLTGGDYYHLFEGGTFSDCIQNIYHLATSESGLIDIHTTLDNGFCYGRYRNSNSSGGTISGMYYETGRYSGVFPFEIEIAGLYDGELFSKQISLNKEEDMKSDSLTAIWWHGKEILEMENSPNSYSIINDIIEKSIKNRILCNYTAFLCLEPGMMGELDEVEDGEVRKDWNMDSGAPVGIENIETAEFSVNVYPNPFKDRINIAIELPEGTSIENSQFEIYDIFGKRIRILNAEEFRGLTEFTIQWDATGISGERVPAGTYLFICTTPDKRISKKLILL